MFGRRCDDIAQMSFRRNHPVRAFSLIELMIVVVIIGIIAAIAIPRMSRGAEGAAENALDGNLTVSRNAIDFYATEHGGTYPSLADFAAELTQYTADDSSTSVTKDAAHRYGPYLRAIPPLPLGQWKGETDLKSPGAIPPVAEEIDAGWLESPRCGG